MKFLSLFFAAVFVISSFIGVTYAWDNEQQVVNDLYGSKTKLVSVELYLYEKGTDILIPGSVFYLFKEDGTQVGGRYVTDENGNVSVSLPVGNYYFEEITPSGSYTFDIDENGKNIKKYPFTVTGDEDPVIVKAYNIRLKGDLLIRKTVENADGTDLTEEQLETAFTFTVTFSDGNAYTYRIDGGEERTLESGVTLSLRHGQTAEFTDIPTGVLYDVTETPTENYVSTSDGNRGNITKEQSTALFTNVYKELETDEKTEITVTKKVEGEISEADAEKEFSMTLTVGDETFSFTLKADESKTFEIAVGSTYIVREEDYYSDGFSQKIKNGFGVATEEPTETTVTNTFIGEVTVEISGEKTWDTSGFSGIALPESITLQLKNGEFLQEEKTVRPDGDGRWLYSFTVPKYNSDGTEAEYTVTETPITSWRATYDGYDITNTFVLPITADLPQITKTITGKNVPVSEFEFVLQGSGSPMPDGVGGSLEYFTFAGEGSFDIGSVTFTEPGVHTYTVYELNKGESGWKYDTSIYTVTYTVTESNGALACEYEILKNGTATDKILFENYYNDVSSDQTLDVRGMKVWVHGANAERNRPTSLVVYLYANGELLAQKQITEEDGWKYEFNVPLYDADGNVITYSVDEEKIENYEKQIAGYNLINTYVGSASAPVTPPPTDDAVGIDVWTVLTVVSGAGFIVTTVLRKRYCQD